MIYRITILLLTGVTLIYSSCDVKQDWKNPEVVLNLPDIPLEYANVNYPNHIQQAILALDNTPVDNPITNNGATLGRVLFYDKALSKNNQVSCASCHRAENGFSDERAKSEGFEQNTTRRNSMTLLNVRFYKSGKMFWDERVATLEEQVLLPIQDHIEMGMDLSELVQKLATKSYYLSLFEKAFGNDEITSEKIAKALAQFIRSMVTYRSKYDQVLAGTEVLTIEEQKGKAIYDMFGTQQGCQGCHGGGFLDLDSYRLQLGQIPTRSEAVDLTDLGLYEVSQLPVDSFKFKVSTLRNIEMTAPYLHDGTITDLSTLFASSHHNFGMSTMEINSLISFLKTLTDYAIVGDERFLTPFVD